MSEHTEGRLTVADANCRNHTLPSEFAFDLRMNGVLVAVVKLGNIGKAGEVAAANARRLVAAWNACEHLSTETLERMDFGPQHLAAAMLNDQRELIEALRELLEAHSAIFPAFLAGKEAQQAWAERKGAADEKARALLARLSPKNTENSDG